MTHCHLLVVWLAWLQIYVVLVSRKQNQIVHHARPTLCVIRQAKLSQRIMESVDSHMLLVSLMYSGPPSVRENVF